VRSSLTNEIEPLTDTAFPAIPLGSFKQTNQPTNQQKPGN